MPKNVIAGLVIVVLCFSLFGAGCSKSDMMQVWANNYRPLNARFQRVAVFTDFTMIRKSKTGLVIPIDESLKYAKALDDQIISSLILRDYEVATHEKYLIGSFANIDMNLADSRDDDGASFSPPFHVDPDISSIDSFSELILKGFGSFANMIAGGEGAVEKGALDKNLSRRIAKKYNADAIVFAIAVARAVPGEKYAAGPISPDSFYKLRAPVLVIGIFNAYEGKLLWYGQELFPNGKLGSGYAGSAKALLADFPQKGKVATSLDPK